MANEEREPKVMVLPSRDEMLRRLESVTTTSHVVEGLYPLIVKYAGQEKIGSGVTMMLVLAIRTYTIGMDAAVTEALHRVIPDYLRALIDDDDVLADAMEAHRARRS